MRAIMTKIQCRKFRAPCPIITLREQVLPKISSLTWKGGGISTTEYRNQGNRMLRQGEPAKWGALILTVGLVASVNAADPPFNLPPIRAVPATDGGNILCYGDDCAGLLDSLSPRPDPFETNVDELIDLPAKPVDRQKFCKSLKSQQPSNCNASSPPSTPDTDPNWQPNGCGDNWFTQKVIQLGLMTIVPDDFAGDYNAPYAGVSFLAACNRHDRCYGVAFDKAGCDQRFGDEMRTACSTVSNSAGYNQCTGLADIYRGAVATFGATAYETSSRDHTCAVWAKDMSQNGCSQ